MGRVVVEFVGKDSSLTAAQERTVKGAANITAEYKKISAETAKLDREAARVWEKTMTPLERYNAKMKDLGRLVDAGKISQEQFGRAAAMAKADLDKQASSLQTLVSSGSAKLAGMAASYIGVQQAISAINAEYSAWIENERRLGKETIKTTGGARAFAALQPGELMQSRIQEVLKLTGNRMPTDQAFEIVQGLQSASGDYKTAIREFTGTILKAQDIGMKPELAQELVTMARPLGIDPGTFVRQAYITGEAATRGVNEVADAAVGLANWTDKLLGMAAVGQITGLYGMRARPFVEQAGKGLSAVSPAAEWFQKQGLGPKATEEQRLRMLVAKSIDTVEEYVGIGITDTQMMQGMMNLVTGFDNVEKYKSTIVERTKAGTDVLGTTVRNMEQFLPPAEAERRVSDAIGRIKSAEFSPSRAANRAAQAEVAATLTEMGWQRRFAGMPMWTEEGEINNIAFGFRSMMEYFFGDYQALSSVMANAAKTQQELNRNTRPRPAVPAPER